MKMKYHKFLVLSLLSFGIVTTQSKISFSRAAVLLKEAVASSRLIVKCKLEIKDSEKFYRVIEVWKGEYNQELFYGIIPPKGYLPAYDGRADYDQMDLNDEGIIFYGPWNNRDGKFTAGSQLVLPIRNNEILWNAGSTVRGMAETEPRVYTVKEFKKAVLEILATNKQESSTIGPKTPIRLR
jgi:hypothetical protein